MTPLDAVLIVVLVAGASIVQALTGLGFGLMIVPPLILVVGVKDAVVVANLLGTILSAGLLLRTHEHADWRSALTLLAGALVGMPLGLAVLTWADPDVLQVGIAVAVIVFTVLLSRGLRLHGGGIAGDGLTGVLSGVLRMSTSMSGPPVVIYLQGKGLGSIPFRATISAFFVLSGVAGALLFFAGGRITGDVAREVLVGLPALAAGFAGGQLLYSRVDEARFRKLVLAVLFASAAVAIGAVLFH